MIHSKVRARLSDYLERDLPPELRTQVRDHLASCADCSAELHELEHTVALLRRLPQPEAPPYLADRVMARVRAGEAEPLDWFGWLRALLRPAIAAPLTAAALGVAIFANLGQAPTPQAEPAPGLAAAPAVPETLAAAAAPAPTRARAPRRAQRGPVTLESTRQPTPEVAEQQQQIMLEMQRQMWAHRVALEMARRGQSEEMARVLRGAGHPHSSSLASHFEEQNVLEVAQASWRGGRRR